MILDPILVFFIVLGVPVLVVTALAVAVYSVTRWLGRPKNMGPETPPQNMTLIRHFVRRVQRMTGLEILTLFLYVPVIIWILVSYSVSYLFSGPRETALLGAPWVVIPALLFEWSIFFAIFAAICYVLGNMISIRKKRSPTSEI